MTMKRISMGLNASRRGFLKNSLAGAGTAGAAKLFADDHSSRPNKGDAALLRFAAAAEILETDFWTQYNELGGIQDAEVSAGSGKPTYTSKLLNLNADFSQYIQDNTDDEITHFTF